MPKLFLPGAALANAAAFSIPKQTGLKRVGGGALTRRARLAGFVSLVLWAGVIATTNRKGRLLPD